MCGVNVNFKLPPDELPSGRHFVNYVKFGNSDKRIAKLVKVDDGKGVESEFELWYPGRSRCSRKITEDQWNYREKNRFIVSNMSEDDALWKAQTRKHLRKKQKEARDDSCKLVLITNNILDNWEGSLGVVIRIDPPHSGSTMIALVKRRTFPYNNISSV